jgi:RNA polymerase sigma-70 factor (ECF subfamily)
MNKLERNFDKITGLKFPKFYKEELPKLIYFLNGWTTDEDDSKDLANRAFVQFLEKLDMYNAERGALNTWLFTIARYMVNREFKDKKKLPTVSMDKEVANNANLGMFIAEPDDKHKKITNLLNKRKADVIKKCIYTLPEKQVKYKRVLILREIDAMSYEEIANYLDLNISTVKSQIKKGRKIVADKTKTTLLMVDKIGIDDFEH